MLPRCCMGKTQEMTSSKLVAGTLDFLGILDAGTFRSPTSLNGFDLFLTGTHPVRTIAIQSQERFRLKTSRREGRSTMLLDSVRSANRLL